MDEEISRAKMETQVDLLRESSLVDRNGWEVNVDGVDVFVEMPVDGADYTLKVNFDDYPQQAPSYQFVDDWPDNVRGIQEDKGICIDGTRECYTNYNHDEREEDWDPDVYDLPSMVHKIYRLIRRS